MSPPPSLLTVRSDDSAIFGQPERARSCVPMICMCCMSCQVCHDVLRISLSSYVMVGLVRHVCQVGQRLVCGVVCRSLRVREGTRTGRNDVG